MRTMRISQFPNPLSCRSSMFSIFLYAVFLSTSTLFSAQEVTDDSKKLFIDEQLRLADGLSKRGHYQMAIEEYRRIISNFPDDPLAADAFSQLAETYASNGDLDKAIENFRLFLKKFPDIKTAPAVRVNYSITLFRTGTAENRKDAVSILQSVKTSKDSPAAVKYAAGYHLGKIFLETGETGKAKSELSELATQEIKSNDDMHAALARLELAVILDKEGRKDLAENLIKSLVDNRNTPPEVLSAALNFLAAINFERKQYLQAADNYEQICLLFPGTPAAGESYFRRLDSLIMAKEHSKVIKELDGKISKLGGGTPDPQSEKLYYIKADAQMDQGMYVDALKTFSEITSSTASSPEYYSKSAIVSVQCSLRHGKSAESLAMAKNFLANRRISTDAKKTICDIVISAMKTPHEKISFMKDSVSTARDTGERFALKLSLAALYANLMQIDNALSVYNDTLGECPDGTKPECLLGIARAYELAKQDKDALEYYGKIKTSYPSSAQYPEAMLRTAVIILYQNPGSDEAREILLKLEKESMASRDIRGNAVFYLSHIDFTRGDFEKADEGFRKIASDTMYEGNLVFMAKEYLLWSIASVKLTPESDMLFSELSSSENMILSANPDMLLFLGGKFSEAGRTDDSIKCYQAVAKNQNTDYRINALTGLGLTYVGKGDLDKAVRFLREAEKIKPDNKDIYSEMLSHLGMALSKKGDRNEAVLVFEKCIEMSASKTASARARLGMAEILSKNPDDLNRANRYAMSVFILSDDPALTRQAMLLSIDLSVRQKNLEEARATFDELKKRFPDILKDEKVRKISEKLR